MRISVWKLYEKSECPAWVTVYSNFSFLPFLGGAKGEGQTRLTPLLARHLKSLCFSNLESIVKPGRRVESCRLRYSVTRTLQCLISPQNPSKFCFSSAKVLREFRGRILFRWAFRVAYSLLYLL